MENIIQKFNKLDLWQTENAYNHWLTKKNLETINSSAKAINKKSATVVDPALYALNEAQVELLISKLQKRNETFNSWLHLKNRQKKAELAKELALQEQLNKNKDLEQELESIKREQTRIKFEEWKLKKDVERKKEKEITSKPLPHRPIRKFEKSKPIKLKRANHKEPFSYIVEHVKSTEPTLSPPILYNEKEKYQKEYPDFYRKYRNLVANGK